MHLRTPQHTHAHARTQQTNSISSINYIVEYTTNFTRLHHIQSMSSTNKSSLISNYQLHLQHIAYNNRTINTTESSRALMTINLTHLICFDFYSKNYWIAQKIDNDDENREFINQFHTPLAPLTSSFLFHPSPRFISFSQSTLFHLNPPPNPFPTPYLITQGQQPQQNQRTQLHCKYKANPQATQSISPLHNPSTPQLIMFLQRLAKGCSSRATTTPIQTQTQRQMSFYRPNGNYGESDKFAWEVGGEALGIKPLNDVGTLKQTPYHWAMLNKTQTYGLPGAQVGNFGSKVMLRPQGYEQQLSKLANAGEEIRIPKHLFHNTDQARSFSVGGYEYRALFKDHDKHVFIPKPHPSGVSHQLTHRFWALWVDNVHFFLLGGFVVLGQFSPPNPAATTLSLHDVIIHGIWHHFQLY